MSAPPQRGMSGLYANLLADSSSSTSNSSATISKAPVVFSQQGSASSPPGNQSVEDGTSSTQKKINAAALRFQPTITKRPVPAQKKAAGSIPFKPIGMSIAAAGPKADDPVSTTTTVAKPTVKTTLEDWVGDDDDVNGFYTGNQKERQQRGGRKKRKKNRVTPPPPTNWDDIYDPLRPNSYEEYKEGDEKIREMEDWRERLYGNKRGVYDDSSDEDDRRSAAGRFAPPSNYSFAPPQFGSASHTNNDARGASPLPPPPPIAPVEVPDDTSGEDAFARRMRMSQEGRVGYSQTLVHTEATHSLPISGSIPPPPPPPPPPLPDAIISRAPVMYQPSPADSEHAVSGDDSYSPPGSPEPTAEPSSRPGQAGFAKRLMEKQGWKAGQGLGRDGKGITKAIQMVSSGKKGHAGRGKIVDKNKRKNVDSGNGGKSEVVVMTGIIDGKRNDFDHAELLQKIGDQYKRYGRVVQIVIRWNDDDEEEEGEEGSSKGSKARVYMLFADQGSALMAVDGLQRREIFQGNITKAAFYPKEKFEQMIFE